MDKPAAITVLNKNRQEVLIIDDYFSLVWPELYSGEGLFTLEVPIEYAENEYILTGNYLVIEESDRVMIITDLNPSITDTTSKLVISGSSAETLLRSRVLTTTVFIDGSVQDAINTLFEVYFSDPFFPEQDIFEFEFDVSSDPNVTSKTITNTYEPDSMYNVIKSICDAVNLGFRVVLNSNDVFEFQLYSGIDRSYDQSVLPFVVFSEEYNNIQEQSFYISTQDYKNIAVVVTEDLIYPLVYVYDGLEPEGIDRKELLVDATGINRQIPDAPDLTDGEYYEILWQKGLDELRSRRPMGVFDGDIDIEGSFKINEDFFLGDIVQCVFASGETAARITEFVRSYSESGWISYASFQFNL